MLRPLGVEQAGTDAAPVGRLHEAKRFLMQSKNVRKGGDTAMSMAILMRQVRSDAGQGPRSDTKSRAGGIWWSWIGREMMFQKGAAGGQLSSRTGLVGISRRGSVSGEPPQ